MSNQQMPILSTASTIPAQQSLPATQLNSLTAPTTANSLQSRDVKFH